VVGDNPCPNGVRIGCDDNCTLMYDTSQVDSDHDGVGDECDLTPWGF